MMALDAKAIKEEIPDKDIYETTNSRRTKGKDQCRTPDSPESVRAIAPKSPMSPHHHVNLIPPRSTHNGSSSPNINGSGTPPPASSAPTTHAATPTVSQDTSRALTKVKRFLGALVQFGQDTSPDIGDRVRALILSLASGGLTSDEFKIALQEATNFPLRPYVLPFLKTHIPFLQREISSLARANHQSTIQYVRANENSVLEFVHTSTEHADIFLPIEGSSSIANSNGIGHHINGNGVILKRRGSESFYEHQNGPQEWNDYMLPTKRQHVMLGNTGHIFPSVHQTFYEYQSGGPTTTHSEPFSNLLDKPNMHRDDRDIRNSITTENHRSGGGGGGNNGGGGGGGGGSSSGVCNNRIGGEEEWKNIHTMLNCISAMVDKTKRAITILQQRGVDTSTVTLHSNYQETTIADIKRQTEEKVAEFRRNAEDAVNQVKRQAVIEIQRAVAAAETRAVEVMAQERVKMEKIFSEMVKNNPEDSENQSQTITGTQNTCWNCGRKANETCSGCNIARYCGAFCQHKDWEQHHQICGNSRIESNGAKHPPMPRTIVPPTRASPLQSQQQQQQQQQQQPQQQTIVTVSNGGVLPSAGIK